jgi:hypothetical protein
VILDGNIFRVQHDYLGTRCEVGVNHMSIYKCFYITHQNLRNMNICSWLQVLQECHCSVSKVRFANMYLKVRLVGFWVEFGCFFNVATIMLLCMNDIGPMYRFESAF